MTPRLTGPIIRYAGGKTHLLPEIIPRLPPRISTYFEPFIGGGAVFFALAGEGRFERAIISDTSPDLVTMYQVLKDDPYALLMALEPLRGRVEDDDFYYGMRRYEPESPVDVAARFIYLNKTCFNGLWRVNRKGKFNVPIGSFKTPPQLPSEAHVLEVHAALANTLVMCCDFEKPMRMSNPADAIYCDPPYVPASATSNFTAYSAGWGPEDQLRLRREFVTCVRRGVPIVLSNSKAAEEMWRELSIEGVDVSGVLIDTVKAQRSINSKGGRRGAVGEILVTSVLKEMEDHHEHR